MTIRNKAIILIVVAAVILVAVVTIPGYAKNKLASSVKAITAEVKTFALVNTLETPARSIYRMHLTVTNKGTVPVTYTARSLVVRFTPSHEIGANGNEQGTLRPGESVDIDRDFTLFAPVVEDFRAAKTLNVKGNLNMEVSARWLFWNLETGWSPEVEHTMFFD